MTYILKDTIMGYGQDEALEEIEERKLSKRELKAAKEFGYDHGEWLAEDTRERQRLIVLTDKFKRK